MSHTNGLATPIPNRIADDDLRAGIIWPLIAALVGLLLVGGLIAVVVLDFSRFPHHFVEQDSWQLFVWLGGGAALYLTVLATVLGIPLGGRALVVASGLSLAVFVLLVSLFEAAALYFREDPPGGGAHRQGSDYDSYVSSAELLFAALYGVVLVLGTVIGRALGSWRTGALTLTAVVLFMLLSFPFVEFNNECNIGRSVFLSGIRC